MALTWPQAKAYIRSYINESKPLSSLLEATLNNDNIEYKTVICGDKKEEIELRIGKFYKFNNAVEDLSSQIKVLFSSINHKVFFEDSCAKSEYEYVKNSPLSHTVFGTNNSIYWVLASNKLEMIGQYMEETNRYPLVGYVLKETKNESIVKELSSIDFNNSLLAFFVGINDEERILLCVYS